MKSWKTKIEVRIDRGEKKNQIERSESIKILNGIFQGDGLCPLLFCLCINIISWYQYSMEGVKINKKTKLTHLLFIDDNKQFSLTKNLQDEVVKTEEAFRSILLNYNGDKSAFVKIEKGKFKEGEDIKVGNGQIIPCLKKDQVYKYLGVYENIKVDENKTWEKNIFNYMQRAWLIWNSAASGYYKIRAMNLFANPKIMYIEWMMDINIELIRKADKEVRRILRERGAMAPGSCKALLYLERKRGGRGLVSIEALNTQCRIKIALYLMNNEDKQIKEVLKIEKGRRKKNLIEEAVERAEEELELKIKEKEGKWGIEVEEKGQRILVSEQKKIGKLIKEKQQMKYLRELQEKRMAGVFYNDFINIENWNKGSWRWLEKWKDISVTTERKYYEIFEQLVPTKYRRKEILGEKIEDRCRLCKKKKETVRHILSNCDQLASNLYLVRHNNCLKVLYWWVLHKYKLEERVREWNDIKQPEVRRENERVIVYWNAKVQSIEYTDHNKPDMLIIDKKKKEVIITEMSCPWDKNINRKTEEKNNKYQVIRQELREQYQGYKIKQANIVIGALGTITELENELEKISKRAKSLSYKIQRVVITLSISIIDKFLKRE